MTAKPKTTAKTAGLETRSIALTAIISQVSELASKFFENRIDLVAEEKSPRDYVSQADRAVEDRFRDLIHRHVPDDVVVGEEMGGTPTHAYWIIDPIDGTSNFLSGLPLWGVSIAYVQDGEPILGAISVPALSLSVQGDIEQGLDDASRKKQQSGLPARVHGVGRNGNWKEKDRASTERAVEEAGFYPINLGSCAISLAFSVLGQMAGYIETGIGFWDCAAGIAICKASGMDVVYSDGLDSEYASVCCGPLASKRFSKNILYKIG